MYLQNFHIPEIDVRQMATVRKNFRRRGIYLLPNLFTTAALFAGFYSIVAAVDGNFQKAGAAIFIAFILDGLDGRVARLTNTSTPFGREYDSLSDMVSFGLAPAVVVYQWGVERLTEWNLAWGRAGWLVAFLFAVAAALRLARFNTQAAGMSKRFFVGLPSPSAAALVAAFVWFGSAQKLAGLGGLAAAFLITAAAGALMVTRLGYYSFKEVNLGRRIPFTYLLGIVLIFILISLDPPTVLLAMFGSYAASGPLYWLWRRRRARSGTGTGNAD
ncbi:MAG: CDP-diacylglycerol--serine O-phosphatidyltransferase [Woeseia sp.]